MLLVILLVSYILILFLFYQTHFPKKPESVFGVSPPQFAIASHENGNSVRFTRSNARTHACVCVCGMSTRGACAVRVGAGANLCQCCCGWRKRGVAAWRRRGRRRSETAHSGVCVCVCPKSHERTERRTTNFANKTPSERDARSRWRIADGGGGTKHVTVVFFMACSQRCANGGGGVASRRAAVWRSGRDGAVFFGPDRFDEL